MTKSGKNERKSTSIVERPDGSLMDMAVMARFERWTIARGQATLEAQQKAGK